MQELTDADRAEINRAIAEAMGMEIVCHWFNKTFADGKPIAELSHKHTCWRKRTEGNPQCKDCSWVERPEPPDFFTDANAVDRLVAWLRQRLAFIRLVITDQSATVGLYKIWPSVSADDWKEALCLAVVEQGKFCPECKDKLIEARKGCGSEVQGYICQKCKTGIEVNELLNWRVRPQLLKSDKVVGK